MRASRSLARCAARARLRCLLITASEQLSGADLEALGDKRETYDVGWAMILRRFGEAMSDRTS